MYYNDNQRKHSINAVDISVRMRKSYKPVRNERFITVLGIPVNKIIYSSTSLFFIMRKTFTQYTIIKIFNIKSKQKYL